MLKYILLLTPSTGRQRHLQISLRLAFNLKMGIKGHEKGAFQMGSFGVVLTDAIETQESFLVVLI